MCIRDRLSRPRVSGAAGPGQLFFDTAAFAAPARATWGNLTRNAALSGPTYANLDLSLAKRLRVSQSTSVEIFLDVFNATNSPHFLNPNGLVGSATFGQVTETPPRSERTLRFGGRVVF